MSEFVTQFETEQGNKKYDFKSLGNFPTAKVGQFLKVTAIDENGSPIDWEMATVESGGGGSTWELIDKIDNTVGYSGEWTAPDVFGDGSAYDLGVYMIGGGGSGGAARILGNYSPYASGGASGYGKNIIIEAVTPGLVYPWVIGAKGEGVTTNSTYTAMRGNTGGSTSFNGETVDGGNGGESAISTSSITVYGANGGQGSDEATSGAKGQNKAARFGCCPTQGNGGVSQSSRNGQNQFDLNMITLCAGGYANYTSAGDQEILAMPDGTKGGDGKRFSGTGTGESATGYGNGGGGAVCSSSSTTVTSGAGSDGVIFLYARKVVSE